MPQLFKTVVVKQDGETPESPWGLTLSSSQEDFVCVCVFFFGRTLNSCLRFFFFFGGGGVGGGEKKHIYIYICGNWREFESWVFESFGCFKGHYGLGIRIPEIWSKKTLYTGQLNFEGSIDHANQWDQKWLKFLGDSSGNSILIVQVEVHQVCSSAMLTKITTSGLYGVMCISSTKFEKHLILKPVQVLNTVDVNTPRDEGAPVPFVKARRWVPLQEMYIICILSLDSRRIYI